MSAVPPLHPDPLRELLDAAEQVYDALPVYMQCGCQQPGPRLAVAIQAARKCMDAHPAPAAALLVWRWESAPEQYRALSTHGGDEDWVMFCPDGFDQPYWWPEPDEGDRDYVEAWGFADFHAVPGGQVVIWAHA